ncbi:MAG: hypothetical protein LBC85_11135 [Fibromonadaceae bacterium]|jgi:hypothetical protein|nr:hypothetical protein [Fibromonadaceae bacterium]
MIKEIDKSDLKQALDLVNEVFSEFVAVDYSEQGITTFQDYLKNKYEEVSADLESGHKKAWGGSFEIWNQICTFDYNYLKEGAIEENNYKIVSLEKLLFLKALAMETPKYHKDLEMIVKLILNKAYEKQQNG